MTLQNAENFTVFFGADSLKKIKALQNASLQELACAFPPLSCD
jgi:hypothetical protein